MDEISDLLARAYQTRDQAEVQRIWEVFERFGADPNVLNCLLQILFEDEYPETVRVNACVWIRLMAERHWTEDTAGPFRELLVAKIPELIVRAPLFLKECLKYLGEIVIRLMDLNTWQNVLPLVTTLAKGSEAEFSASLVFYNSSVQKFEQSLNEHPELEQLTEELVNDVARVFSRDISIVIRTECLSSLKFAYRVLPDAVRCRGEIWAKAVELLAQGCPLTAEVMKFLEALLSLYCIVDPSMPGLEQLLIMSLHLLPQEWTCNKGELISLATRLLAKEKSHQIQFLKQNLVGLVQESLLPLYSLSAEMVALADADPTQFIIDLPMSFVDCEMRLFFDTMGMADLLLELVRTSIIQFSRDNNAANLFSRLLFVCPGWSMCYKKHRDVIESMYLECAGLLLQNPSTLAQVSYLMLMENEYTIENVTNPEHLLVALEGLRSPKPLVRYYSIHIIHSILRGLTLTVKSWKNNIHDDDTWQRLESLRLSGLDRAREILVPEVLVVVLDSAAGLSREFGCPDLLMIFSMVVKDSSLMGSVSAEPPAIVARLLELLCDYVAREIQLSSLFDAILNFLRHFQADVGVKVEVCKSIFTSIMSHFDIITANENNLDSLVQTFNGIVYSCPEVFPEFWQALFRLWPVCCDADNISIGTFSYLLHNLMLKDPETVRRELDRFLEMGVQLLSVDTACVLTNYNSALFTVAVPGSIPNEYLERVFANLENVSTDSIVIEIDSWSYLIMALAKYDPKLISAIDNIFLRWVEFVDSSELGYVISLCWGHIPMELALTHIKNIVTSAECLARLAQKEEDYEGRWFEDEYCCVDPDMIPIITPEQEAIAFGQFLEAHLQELEALDCPVAAFLGK